MNKNTMEHENTVKEENNNTKNKMKIILKYHSLETRNPKYIPKIWDGSVFLGLLIIIISGMGSELTLQRILDTYDDQNIFTAKLVFIPKHQSDNFTVSDYNNGTMFICEDDSCDIVKMYDIENIIYDIIVNEPELFQNKNKSFQEEIQDDYKFLKEMKIDQNKTIYGPEYIREYLLFYPIFSTIIAVQWLIVYFNFRTHGYYNRMDWKKTKSWKIVVPSLIVHFLMTTSTLIYIITAEYYFSIFCKNLGKYLNHPEKFSCAFLMDNLYIFSWKEFEFIASNSAHYILYTLAVISLLIAWSSILFITILRFIFGVDFQLNQVTITAFIPNKINNELRKKFKLNLKNVDNTNENYNS